jgi:hypothetical protein
LVTPGFASRHQSRGTGNKARCQPWRAWQREKLLHALNANTVSSSVRFRTP